MEKKINPNNSEKLAKTLSQDTYDIFISYKVTENKEEAKTLYDILHDEGYSVFWDKDKLKGGEKWNKQLEVALRNARFFFVFTTPESLNSFQEGWNEDGNDKYSYYCHEIDLITNRVNDENVYCLPLFTDSLQVIRNYNEFFKRDNTARKCIDTLSECEGHAYSKLDGNTTFRSGLIEYIYKQLSNVGIFPFYKKSRDVITGELFYDPKRASSEQGFKAGSRYYVKRSIDNSISNFASMQDENSFLFISGRPGSGKTRALYEWLHSPSMENENVVVLNRHTIRPVYEKLMKFKSSSFEFSSTNKSLYFVCDQVNDVFNFLTSEEQLKFLSVIYSKQYKFVGTDTPYDNDIFLHKINISDWPYKIVHIKDLTEDEIREFQFVYGYKNNDNKKKIAADFVELLRAHKNKVINNIYKYDQENAINGQLRVFLRVVQIAKEILKKNDLESIRNLLNGIFPGSFDDSVIVRLLNILSFPEYGISILDLGVSEKLTVYELFLSVDNYNVNIYDDLAWEMMQTRLDGNENILYDLYSLKDTQAICNIFNKCDLFDNPAYNYMLFYNLPFKNRNEELNDYYSRCDVMRNYIIGRIDKWKNNHKWDTNDRDFRTLVSAITERSVNIKQIDQSIKLLPVTDAKSIRSLYKIAKTWHLNPGDEKQFEGFDNLLVEQTDKYHKTNSVSFDDISRIHYEIDSHYKTLSFEDCYNQCKPLMDHDFLNEDCNHRDLDFLFTDLASLCKKSEDFDHFWAFFDSVAQKMCSYMMSVYTAKAIAKSISRFFYGKKYAENERQLLSRLISHIPVVIKFGSIVDVENRQLYLMYISRIILVQRCFYTSFCIYEEAREKLGMAEKGDHELRIISLCLKNCQANEFSMAVVYIVNLSVEDKRIFYNILIRKAPTQEEAYYILRFLSKEGTDSYTLSNCLKKVENVSFIPTCKIEKDLAKIHDENECREQMEWLKMNIEEDDKILLDDAYAVLKRIPFKERKKWQQSLLLFFEGKERRNFINVYELLNHPYIHWDINSPSYQASFNLVYKLAQTPDQELYIHRLLDPATSTKSYNQLPSFSINEFIIPTLISKNYRSMKDALIVFDQLGDKKNALTTTYIYNALYGKFVKEDLSILTHEEKQKILISMNNVDGYVQEGLNKQIIKMDIYLFCNRHHYYLKSGIVIDREAGDFIFKSHSTKFTESFLEVLRSERIIGLPPEDIRKIFVVIIRHTVEYYDELCWKRYLKIFDYFKSEYELKWHSSIKSIVIQLFGKEDYVVKYFSKMNGDVKVYPTTSTNNREEENFKTSKQIIKKLEVDCSTAPDGFVLPSTLNFALDKLQKFSIDAKLYNDVKNILQEYRTVDKLSLRGYALMVCLAPNREEKIFWLNLLDKQLEQVGEINEKALGILCVEGSIDIERSRGYFERWLNCFREIYITPEKIAQNLSSRQNTLGRRLRMEFSQPDNRRSRKIIKDILLIYSYCNEPFDENNFIDVSIDDAVGMIEEQREIIKERIYKLENARKTIRKSTSNKRNKTMEERNLENDAWKIGDRESIGKWLDYLKMEYGAEMIIRVNKSNKAKAIITKHLRRENNVLKSLLIERNEKVKMFHHSINNKQRVLGEIDMKIMDSLSYIMLFIEKLYQKPNPFDCLISTIQEMMSRIQSHEELGQLSYMLPEEIKNFNYEEQLYSAAD